MLATGAGSVKKGTESPTTHIHPWRRGDWIVQCVLGRRALPATVTTWHPSSPLLFSGRRATLTVALALPPPAHTARAHLLWWVKGDEEECGHCEISGPPNLHADSGLAVDVGGCRPQRARARRSRALGRTAVRRRGR